MRITDMMAVITRFKVLSDIHIYIFLLFSLVVPTFDTSVVPIKIERE
jgi:hypothetical protein